MVSVMVEDYRRDIRVFIIAPPNWGMDANLESSTVLL